MFSSAIANATKRTEKIKSFIFYEIKFPRLVLTKVLIQLKPHRQFRCFNITYLPKIFRAIRNKNENKLAELKRAFPLNAKRLTE
jgi:hypothetical protein